MFYNYASVGNIVNEIRFVDQGPTVVLVSGVNGVGKTTIIKAIKGSKYKVR